jgi:hypothetical protein
MKIEKRDSCMGGVVPQGERIPFYRMLKGFYNQAIIDK